MKYTTAASLPRAVIGEKQHGLLHVTLPCGSKYSVTHSKHLLLSIQNHAVENVTSGVLVVSVSNRLMKRGSLAV